MKIYQEVLTVSECAEILRLSEGCVRKLVRTGKLKNSPYTRTYRITREELMRFIREEGQSA